MSWRACAPKATTPPGWPIAAVLVLSAIVMPVSAAPGVAAGITDFDMAYPPRICTVICKAIYRKHEGFARDGPSCADCGTPGQNSFRSSPAAATNFFAPKTITREVIGLVSPVTGTVVESGVVASWPPAPRVAGRRASASSPTHASSTLTALFQVFPNALSTFANARII
jgi:hypothetical protein